MYMLIGMRTDTLNPAGSDSLHSYLPALFGASFFSFSFIVKEHILKTKNQTHACTILMSIGVLEMFWTVHVSTLCMHVSFK